MCTKSSSGIRELNSRHIPSQARALTNILCTAIAEGYNYRQKHLDYKITQVVDELEPICLRWNERCNCFFVRLNYNDWMGYFVTYSQFRACWHESSLHFCTTSYCVTWLLVELGASVPVHRSTTQEWHVWVHQLSIWVLIWALDRLISLGSSQPRRIK